MEGGEVGDWGGIGEGGVEEVAVGGVAGGGGFVGCACLGLGWRLAFGTRRERRGKGGIRGERGGREGKGRKGDVRIGRLARCRFVR